MMTLIVGEFTQCIVYALGKQMRIQPRAGELSVR